MRREFGRGTREVVMNGMGDGCLGGCVWEVRTRDQWAVEERVAANRTRNMTKKKNRRM